MIADEVLRPAGKVGELRGRDVNPQARIKRGEHVAEMNGPDAFTVNVDLPDTYHRAAGTQVSSLTLAPTRAAVLLH